MNEAPAVFYGESQERQEFRKAIRSLLEKSWTAQDARAYVDGSTEAFDKVVTSLRRDMSLGGILVPEERGGLGGAYGDAAVAAEELGAALFPHDLLGSWIASDALLRTDPAESAETLQLLASEAAPFVFGWPGTDASWRLRDITAAQRSGAGITGSIPFVPGARPDAVVVLPVAMGDSIGLGVVRGSEGVTVVARDTPDLLRPVAGVVLQDADGLVLPLPDADEALTHAVAVGAVLLAAEAVGAARACLDTTVEYGLAREQFGRQLMTFQAVKHRVGAALIEVERARAAVYRAAAKAEEGAMGDALDEFVSIARIAKTSSGAALRLAARESVQFHGAMGFTWENPSHLYLRRWAVSAPLFGRADEHYERLYDYAHGESSS